MPEQKPSYGYAYPLRIEFSGAIPSLRGVINLKAEQAVLDGDVIRVEERGGIKNIGFWANREESIHWLTRIRKAGTYRISGVFAAAAGDTTLELRVYHENCVFQVPRSKSWGRWH